MFPPSTPAGEVIESFQSGVDRLLKTGWLNLSSPFVAEVVKALYDLGGPSPPAQAPALRERPSTEIEKDIAIALDLSLGIGSPECVDKRH